MRKLPLLLLLALCWLGQHAQAQSSEFPNAIYAKLNVVDYGALYDGDLQVSQGFELAYFRNIAPFLNVGVPFKLGLAKLPLTTGNTVTTSFDLVFHLENMRSDAKIVPYAFGGAGYFLEGSKGHAQFPFGFGLNFRVSKYAFINLQGEFRKALKDNRDNVQLGLGYAYLLNRQAPKQMLPADQDKDGTPDSLDQCPTLAGPAVAFGCPDADNDGVADTKDECVNDPGPQATNGCPDYDNDGIADKNDECPTEAGTLVGCPDTDNDSFADKNDECPTEPGAWKGCPDTDNDGIADKDDRCPNDPGPASQNGCPEMVDNDSDNDGTPDSRDDCPTTAGSLRGCPDSDNDNVADKDDLCPTEAGTLGGCPDVDNDGIADKDDQCPTVAGPPSNNGCPPVVDTDNDGIADKDDQCPTVAGPPSNNGCPPVKDTDNDGIADKDDQCPTVAGPASNNGCPLAKDADNDGVTDDKDKCPNAAGPAANSGCPEVKKETKERLDASARAVRFETAKATLKNESFPVLDEVVTIMRQYPDYTLSISGYTDDIGNDERNFRLSQDRAKACYDYLVFRGIKPDRLRHAGFGELRPIADNNTENGREQNRRVEFELVLD